MKIKLDQNLVLRLTIHEKPVGYESGKLLFEPNPTLKEYTIRDGDSKAPTGFTLKVTKSKKTYFIQTRVPMGHAVKAKVGNVSDFPTIAAARQAGFTVLAAAKASNQNPNKIAKATALADYTLGQCFAMYEHSLRNRSRPATFNTLQTLQRAVKKLTKWENTRVKDITPGEIVNHFDAIALHHRTAAEQTFRWAITAVNDAITHEMHTAAAEHRAPTLTYNPFTILMFKKKYRSKDELEQSYEDKNIRNPLTDRELGLWIDEILKRQNTNPTGSDYLLLVTLWGTRKTEASLLKWKSLLSKEEVARSSFVDLDERIVYFRNTKNRQNHVLPLTFVTYQILSNRFKRHIDHVPSETPWVFPAQSSVSKVGYYSDSSELRENICEAAQIKRRTMHDLRRTFANKADEIANYGMVKRLINHGKLSDVTTRYTKNKEISKIREVLEEIDKSILKNSDLASKLFYG